MQLRAHPKMRWKGYSNWPAWGGARRGRDDRAPGGEDGVLIAVDIAQAAIGLPPHLVLTIEYLEDTFSDDLFCDDETVIPGLLEILKRCTRWPVNRIGDLEVDL
jgi:hypothetical protein